MNRFLNASFESVDPDGPEAPALLNFPMILTNIGWSLSKKMSSLELGFDHVQATTLCPN